MKIKLISLLFVFSLLTTATTAELSPFQEDLKDQCESKYSDFEYPDPEFEGKIDKLVFDNGNRTNVGKVDCSSLNRYERLRNVDPGSQVHPNRSLTPVFILAGLTVLPVLAIILYRRKR